MPLPVAEFVKRWKINADHRAGMTARSSRWTAESGFGQVADSSSRMYSTTASLQPSMCDQAP